MPPVANAAIIYDNAHLSEKAGKAMHILIAKPHKNRCTKYRGSGKVRNTQNAKGDSSLGTYWLHLEWHAQN